MSDKPWKGICSPSCWVAKQKRCRCRCGGEHHSEGLRKNNSLEKEADG